MGFGSHQILHIFFIFFFLLLISLNAAEYMNNVHHERESGAEERENHIQKVSGEDEREGNSFLILEKFRVLLGTNSFNFNTREIKFSDDFDYGSQSPSPLPSIEAEPPSPVPLPPTHHHPHHIPPRRHRRKPPPPAEDRDGSKLRTILVSAIASSGAAFILCAIGLIWGCKKFKKQRRSTTRTTTNISSRSKFLSPQNLVKKVSFDPDPNHLYIDSLETALESEPQRFSQEEESQKGLIKLESHTVSSSNFGEILDEPAVCSSVSVNKSHSSDESFHSVDSSSYPLEISTAPPPPPPLPNSSTKIGHKVLGSAALLSSAKNLDSSSGSNHNPQRNFPLPPSDHRKLPPDIPPPPRLPPLSRGQPPPPPPSQLTEISPLGKNGSPLPKLKPLHWDKVRAAPDGSMVWDKLRSSSFEFDEEMIESLFGYNNPINSRKNGEEGKSKSPSPSKHVLEPKRLQNMTILAKALNATAEQVCDALFQGSGLLLQQLEALVKMEPTKEEEIKLKSYKGDINELGSAEKFVMAILKIPFAFLRIKAMLYKETFEDEISHLRKSFSMLEEACKELRSSRLFLKLLEAVLKTGNRMNVGTIRGGARAFKLDALLKLADVKGTDGKTTLLHFVVQEIARSEGLRASDSIIGKINQKSQNKKPENKEEEHIKMGLDLVSGLCTELCNVKKTATIEMEVLASSIKNLKEEMVKLKNLLRKDLIVEEKCGSSGGFLNSMKGFLIYVEKSLKELKEDEIGVLLSVREITEYFHGDVSRDNEANVLGIFVIVRDFLGMLDHVCRELRSIRIASNMNPLAPFS